MCLSVVVSIKNISLIITNNYQYRWGFKTTHLQFDFVVLADRRNHIEIKEDKESNKRSTKCSIDWFLINPNQRGKKSIK